MILLDTTTRRLRILLGGAGAIPFVACWSVLGTTLQDLTSEAVNTGATNGATAVDLVPVPATSTVRKITLVWFRNNSGGAVVATVRYDDNGTARDTWAFSLDNGDQVQYTDGEGWRVFTSAGALKGSGGGGSSLTVEEVDGAPSVTTVSKIKFAQADGFTVTDEGGGIARVNVAAAAAPDISAQTIALLALMEF